MNEAPLPALDAQSQMPSRAQQSWGAFLSIVIIVLMIVVGAFYAWGKRVAEEQPYPVDQSPTPVTP